MSYQVIARKWRPQRFADVIGQQAVTRTLQNAIASQRIAQTFVFAGPRGVGKTTTARILARALNCENGPTAEPCGRCDACVEIAEGRDMDVLEIDAATHTQVDNIREVIISGLSILPVRNRYKVFIIDEVHQLSGHSFNALLKSIEEPPPHVIFMMATTELEKIPETVLSRSQVYEFRTISVKGIADQLRHIVDAEGITTDEQALQLVARDADGSMRDAESKLDQVIAFTGTTITVEDVATVLGLVGRDLLLDTVQAVADEDASAAFALAARAVELGYDLRLVCRELARLVRDLLVLSVDPARIADPEIAAESERDRLTALAARFSREDLLRAFDVLGRAEGEIRAAAQPRYHLEMALLRWIYLRKLVAIEDLIQGTPTAAPARAAAAIAAPARAAAPSGGAKRAVERPRAAEPPPPARAGASVEPRGPKFKDALLAEIRTQKMVFYSTVVAQAQAIDVEGDRVTFVFSPGQRTLQNVFEQNRAWLETLARKLSGRATTVASVQGAAAAGSETGAGASADTTAASEPALESDRKAALRRQAMADAGVQTLLEVFPAEIRDIEEM
jgi:DNA polymerase III subunit gamma/tau